MNSAEITFRITLILACWATVTQATFLLTAFRTEIVPLRRKLNTIHPDERDESNLHCSIAIVAIAVSFTSLYGLVTGIPPSPVIGLSVAAFVWQTYAVTRYYRRYRKELLVEWAKRAILRASPDGRLTRESTIKEF